MRGGLMCSPMFDTSPLWMFYVVVADCDGTAAKAKSLGAQIIVSFTDILNVGRFAALIDAQGVCIVFIKPVV